MSNVFGDHIKVSIFGESHGEAIGVVIGNLPAGEPLDLAQIEREMKRRAPGNSPYATPRTEADEVKIVSGMLKGKTTGAPLCGMIANTNTRSEDYDQLPPRPGHADLAAHAKYHGFQDPRGGGHFSGRLTAPLTFAGAIAKQLLERRGVQIGSHILQIEQIRDESFREITPELLSALATSDFPTLDKEIAAGMQAAILAAKEEGDSVGGIVECTASGLPAGLGEPFFDSMESAIAKMMFSVPAVKGIEFGSGFALAQMRGSQANDPISVLDGRPILKTNHNGGINGGITNGMPVLFRVAFKPTASIAKQQQSVDLEKMEETTMEIKGRHDPCIVPRAVPVVEAALAICLLDVWCREGCR